MTHPNLVHTFGLGFSKTEYDVEDVAVAALGIEGETEIGEMFINSQWIRQRNVNLATRLGLSLSVQMSISHHSMIDEVSIV